MKSQTIHIAIVYVIICSVFLFSSCNKYREYSQKPELESLQQGVRLSAATAYCASVAVSAYKGRPLPDNVRYNTGSGLIYIDTDTNNPLPFNKDIGNIVIAGMWHENSGVLTILFGNFKDGPSTINGIFLLPVMVDELNEKITAVLFKEDIIINTSKDSSILNMSNISIDIFNNQLDHFNNEASNDLYIAVKQNFWFVTIDQGGTYSNIYDDLITINGGGQMAEVESTTGGILYHALLDTKLKYSVCQFNPINGYALSQNFKAGGEAYVDLGNSILRFHNNCDGKAYVEFSCGKYISYFGKNISLGL